MKKSYLVLCILALVFTHHSQTVRVDYDNSSRWFLGFNVGGTWNTTDVSNRTDAGWGLILGKSYGFKSYSPFTFDIRARYLRGFWYGQDSDTSSLAGYSGSALLAYNSQGLTVHNFQSDVHRLGLELAIHMNSITSRSGWDPYIFGGIGFTWHQTFADLINQNDTTGNSAYDYSSMLANSTSLSGQLENTLDEVYDSPLDGYNSGSYNVAFMPSLGFGLGYHIGKRVTLGVEHKTTFTLRDDFDGLVSSVRPKNDLYHYTSLYLRFRFRGKQPSGNVSKNPCYTPSISIIQPTSEITVTNPQYTIEANLSEVTNANQISIVNNVGQNVLFNFNNSSKRLTANVLLVPGQNSFTIRVNNRCGSDSKVVSLNFLNCSLPSATFTSPTTVRDTVRTSAYTVSAAITGISSVQGIRLLQNNVLLNGYSYNTVNGLLQASVNLLPGRNTFTIELFNACGNNTITSEIFYNDCINPSVTLVSPSATGTTVSSPQFMLSALATGVSDKNQVVITQNNIINNAFTLVNGKIDLNTVLNPGINTFTVTLATRCGSASQTFTVNYQTCNAPIITIESPLPNSVVTTSNQTFIAKVFNVENRQNLLVNVNGLALKNITYTKASNSLEVPLNLSSGANSITITATNTCGADVETTTLYYNPCIAPKITLSSMSSAVTNSAYTYNATILNQPSNQGISLTLNGNPVNYSYSNNLLSTNVNLQNGVNTFVLSVSNQCGTDGNTWVVTNNNCVTPTVVLENPTASGITVNSASYNFKASLIGMPSTQGIQFLVNNVATSFNYNNGILTSLLNLNTGANTIKISLQNNCGNDNKDVVINYQNCDVPSISINQPVNNNFTINQSLLNINATVLNINGNQGITAKLNGIGIPYQLNSNLLSASVNLQPGANTILLTATNSCGTDVKAINVNYDNCVQPQVSISNTALTVSNSTFVLNATVTGSNLNQGISLTQNGAVKSYNLNGSALSASVTLTEGLNTFILSAVNSCGNDAKTYTINYEPCLTPAVSITNPASNNLTFNSGSFTFQAQVSHVTLASQVAIIHNGNTISNFTLNDNQIVASVNLSAGNNTIKVTVTTNCGTDSKTITLTGKSCDAPSVTINSSANSTTNTTYNLQASLSNIPTNQGIIVSLNGAVQSNFNYSNGNLTSTFNLVNGENTIVISANNECGNASKTITINYQEPVEEKITICHIPPGNPNNPQTIEIPASAWAAHQAHGDVLGACVPVEEEKITICHIPPGNPNNPQTIEIPASAWAAHQAHGDVLGACVPINPNNGSNGNNGNNGNNGGSTAEETMIICYVGQSRTGNSETITIPISQWPQYQALGATVGPCNQNSNGNGGSPSEETMVICYIGQSRTGNSETLTIPVSQWPQYQALGATAGPCNQNSNGNSGNENPNNSGSGNNNNQNNGGSGTNNSGNENTNGNNGSNGNSGGTNNGGNQNTNGNNGHGNNADGVDSSNPGQGGGGPNGVNDPSGNVDDESTGSGSINSNSNNNGTPGNQNGNNSNSGGTDPNETGGAGTNNSGNENTNGNNGSNGNSGGTDPNSTGGAGTNNGGNQNTNGNNGHGNNADGVDSSNPGQGVGGPNGVNDPSGNVDDESTGSGSINSNSNNNGTPGNQNGNNSNSGGTDPNTNGGAGTNNSGNENTNGNNGSNGNSGGTDPNTNGGSGTNNGGNGNNQQGGSGGGNNSGGGNGNQKNQQINNSGNTRGGSKPTVNQNNSGGNKPAVNQNNSGGNKPDVNKNNSGGNKPTVNQNNPGGNKPDVNKNNSGGNKPTVNQNNSGGNKSDVNKNNSGGNKTEEPKGNKKGGN